MTPARFEQLVKEFQEQEGKIMSHKGNEYSPHEDRLLNFREVAEFLGRTPAEVALAYLMKHVQSIALGDRRRRRIETAHSRCEKLPAVSGSMSGGAKRQRNV